jgi:hypothetical protein
LKVYPGVPPDGVRLIVPFDPPKQATFVTTVLPDTGVAGCVTVGITVPVHPFASVIITV